MSPSAEEVGFAYLPLVPKLDRGFSRQVGNQLKGEFGTAGQQAGRRMGEQVVVGGRRSVAAGAKSFFGPLLAAGAAYKAADFFGNAIEGASDLTESGTKLGEVFGKQASKITQFSAGAASTLGQSDLAARNAAATFGVYGKAAGLANRENVKFSTDLASLAGDLASFYNTDVDQAIEAIGSGLRGESEPLRQYGVLLDDATLRAKALELGIISTTKNALTPQQRVLAAQSVILEQTKIAQGDFGRTSENLANQQRILSANFENASAKLGQGLLPVATDFVQFLNRDGVPAIERFAEWFADEGQEKLQEFGRELRPLVDETLPTLAAVVETGADAFRAAAGPTGQVLSLFNSLPEDGKKAALGVLAVAYATRSLSNRLPSDVSSLTGLRDRLGEVDKKGAALRTGAGLAGAAAIFGSVAAEADGSDRALSGVLTTLGGAATGFAVGGPWGAAVGGGIGLLQAFGRGNDDAARDVENLSEKIDAQTGKLTENGRAQIISNLQKSGIFKDASRLGLDIDTVTRAALGQKDAIDQVTTALEQYQSKQTSTVGRGAGVIGANDEDVKAAQRLRTAIGGSNKALEEARQKAQTNATAQKVLREQLVLTSDRGKQLSRDLKGLPRDLIVRVATPGAVDSKKELKELARQYDLSPKELKTVIRATGMAKTESDVKKLTQRVKKSLTQGIPDEQVKISLAPSAARIAKVDRQLGGKLMATGGQVIGPGTGTSDDIPVWLSNGEHVLTAEEVKKAGGHKNIELVRAAMLRGDFAKIGDLGLPKFAKGGAITPGANMRGLNAAVRQIRRQNQDYADEVGRYMSARISKALTATPPPGQLGAGGRMTATQALRGQQFARSQVGKPYGWGAVGPGAYDCSGFISAVTNAALGTSIHVRRGATGSMPWPQFSGGLGGLFDVGWFTGSPGHTAGTLNGLNVESYGGHGVSVSNRGATDGLFNRHMTMATGGPVFGPGTGTSDSIFARLSNGEHVWTAAEVKAAGGHGAVMAMRRFANGGPVTGSGGVSFQALITALSRNTLAVSRAANVNANLAAANKRFTGFGGSQARLEAAQSRFSDAQTNKASRLDLLNQQQTIRDLEKSLSETEKVGKKGSKRRELVLRKGSLDRKVATAELAEARRELARLQATETELTRARAALAAAQRDRRRYGSEAAEQARVDRAEQAVEAAQQRLESVADASQALRASASLSNLSTLTPTSVQRFLSKKVLQANQFTAVLGGLKQAGTAPWLLEQIQSLGPEPSVIRFGQRLLADTKSLTSINAEVGRLGTVGGAYASLVTNPRFGQAGAANLFNPQQVKQIQVNISALDEKAVSVAIRREVRTVLTELAL